MLRALVSVVTLLSMWVRAVWRGTIRLRRATDAASKKSDRRQHLNAEDLGWGTLPHAVRTPWSPAPASLRATTPVFPRGAVLCAAVASWLKARAIINSSLLF